MRIDAHFRTSSIIVNTVHRSLVPFMDAFYGRSCRPVKQRALVDILRESAMKIPRHDEINEAIKAKSAI